MRQLGVVGLPRNYEIFYEALAGSNHELSLEVVSLSNRPTQDELDRIGRKYFAHNHGTSIVENARGDDRPGTRGHRPHPAPRAQHLEKYGRILDQTAEGLNSRSIISKDLLQKIVGVMSVATVSTIEHGKQVATTLGDKTTELESVKSKLEEYKKLADTDPLTLIWNRRAFDKRNRQIYNSEQRHPVQCADPGRHRPVQGYQRPLRPSGRRQDHPDIAGIMRASIRDDMFVARTGGEEFALIVEGASEDATFEHRRARPRRLIEQTPFGDAPEQAPTMDR